MANSINSNDPNKGKASTSGLPMSGAGNATSSLSGLPMPAIMNHRQVAIPKDGGVPRLAAETFGLWNETARDLIYATNPEIISPLNDLQSGTQLRMPVLSRDALIVKTPNGSNQIYYGSFASPEEAQAELQIVRRIWGGSQAQAVSRQGTTVYRVFVGPFPSKTDANTALESMWFKHLPALN
jgi:hypothetical protein